MRTFDERAQRNVSADRVSERKEERVADWNLQTTRGREMHAEQCERSEERYQWRTAASGCPDGEPRRPQRQNEGERYRAQRLVGTAERFDDVLPQAVAQAGEIVVESGSNDRMRAQERDPIAAAFHAPRERGVLADLGCNGRMSADGIVRIASDEQTLAVHGCVVGRGVAETAHVLREREHQKTGRHERPFPERA